MNTSYRITVCMTLDDVTGQLANERKKTDVLITEEGEWEKERSSLKKEIERAYNRGIIFAKNMLSKLFSPAQVNFF